MVDWIVSKTGSGNAPWVIKNENDYVYSNHQTKQNALSELRSNSKYKGGQALVFYANKPGIDQSFIVGGAKGGSSDFNRGRTL